MARCPTKPDGGAAVEPLGPCGRGCSGDRRHPTGLHHLQGGNRRARRDAVSVGVTDARGKANETFVQKMLGPDATLEPVTDNGHPGYWIAGRPHMFAFTDSDGNSYADTLRLATDTLIFDDN